MRFVSVFGRAVLAALVVLFAADMVVRDLPLTGERLSENFSPAFLDRTLAPALTGKTVVLGDSVLWGWRVAPEQAAVSLLHRRGLRVANLAFQGGSPANTYAILRTLRDRSVRPSTVVFNVNEKQFNRSDPVFASLYPSVGEVTIHHLDVTDRVALNVTVLQGSDAQVDRALRRVWLLYGLRADIREKIFGTTDLANALKAIVNRLSGEEAQVEAAHRPTSERFLGTYDLTPLSRRNLQYSYLLKLAVLLEEQHIRSYAILTPTNHGLLHDYIDVPDYEVNLRTVSTLLQRHGIRVLNYDARFSPEEFIDNDHLTVKGNIHLASLLGADLAR